MFLEIRNLTKIYEDKKVIDNISFDVKKGELLALLGPSGSGKSTILNAIGGFIDVDGDIILDGVNIVKRPPEKRDIATVFQSYGLFNHMNVFENVSYGLKLRKDKKKKQKTREILEVVGLKDYDKKYPDELSGGEKQRVALARSLVLKPKLLLMDEPFANLDQKLRDNMQKELRRIQKEFELTTIFVTHDQREAFVISDNIIILNKGKIMANDNAKNIYNHPKNDFSLEFIGEKNLIDDHYIRPEMVKIADDGEKFLVEDVIFYGQTMELLLYNNQRRLKMVVLNDGNDYKKNDEIFVKYERKKI
ncbi:MAG: ABC transporter ATP-binding protein [Tissierellia bacterium]|nr:ABC transporter ATP-binding protein [Tissierellia bacterium]